MLKRLILRGTRSLTLASGPILRPHSCRCERQTVSRCVSILAGMISQTWSFASSNDLNVVADTIVAKIACTGLQHWSGLFTTKGIVRGICTYQRFAKLHTIPSSRV